MLFRDFSCSSGFSVVLLRELEFLGLRFVIRVLGFWVLSGFWGGVWMPCLFWVLFRFARVLSVRILGAWVCWIEVFFVL